MKISYDPEADALSIIFREAECLTEHVAEGIAFDYAGDGILAGIEILDASVRVGGIDTLRHANFVDYGAEPTEVAA